MSINSVKPFELLSEYERLSLKHIVKIQQQKTADQWSGVGFKIDEHHYAIAINKIVEVLILTETTKIPGIAPWVLGLGNIRGNLIPVVDLKSFLFKKATKTTAHTRMVVINQVGGQVGLVVDEVYGQKHFNQQQIYVNENNDESNDENNNESNDENDADATPLKYVQTTYQDEDIIWNVFEDEMLINDSSFQNAAAI